MLIQQEAGEVEGALITGIGVEVRTQSSALCMKSV